MPRWPPSSRTHSISKPRVEPLGPGIVARSLIALVRAYRRLLGPVVPRACRFEPTCAAFAMEALERHGAGRGLELAIARLTRCHPWHPGGYDPVPTLGA